MGSSSIAMCAVVTGEKDPAAMSRTGGSPVGAAG